MARPIWEGHLRLSLVTCPVAMIKATSEGEGVHFHLLHPETKRRVKQFWRDPEMGEEAPDVPRSSLLHGYEIEKGQYIIVSDDELKSVKLESTKTIQIERFVSTREIDRLYWGEPYFLAPAGKKELQEPYAVIRDAMEGEERVAIGRVVMSGRERTVAIEPRGHGMLLTTLRSHDEVRDERAVFDDIPEVAVDPQMVDIAKAIISRQAGPFDPTAFHDRYAEAVREMVQSKADHSPGAQVKEAQDTNVIDLMEALRRSLSGGSADDAKKTSASKKTRGVAVKQPDIETPAKSKKRLVAR